LKQWLPGCGGDIEQYGWRARFHGPSIFFTIGKEPPAHGGSAFDAACTVPGLHTQEHFFLNWSMLRFHEK